MNSFICKFMKRRLIISVLKNKHCFCTQSDVQLSENSNFAENYEEEYSHTPVMVKEVIEAMNPKNNGVYLDMTFGAGGHSQELLNAASIKLYCLDRDPVAFNKANIMAENYDGRMIPMLGKFSELETLFKKHEVPKDSLDGILIDAGASSMQMDDPNRGFSISRNGPLDMRMDGNRFPNQPTAADVLNHLEVPNLVKIFKVYGEEKQAKKIAQALFDAKYLLKDIKTTGELADLVYGILEGKRRSDSLKRPAHVATKIFQALRIFVNNELNELNYAIDLAHLYLKPGGRLVVLSFHSLEDRIIKRHMLGIEMDEPFSTSLSQKYKNCATWHDAEHINKIYVNKWSSLYKSVIKPSSDEVLKNPRSRSAKLRAAVKNSEEDQERKKFI